MSSKAQWRIVLLVAGVWFVGWVGTLIGQPQGYRHGYADGMQDGATQVMAIYEGVMGVSRTEEERKATWHQVVYRLYRDNYSKQKSNGEKPKPPEPGAHGTDNLHEARLQAYRDVYGF